MIDKYNGIPPEDKTKIRVKTHIVDIDLEKPHCPPGMHYVKGYPTKNGYKRGYCAKNPRKRFGLF
jgi:hypothetical protein